MIRELPETVLVGQANEVDVNATRAKKAPVKGASKKEAIKSPAFYLVLLFTGLFGLASTVSFHVPNFVESIGFTATMAAMGVTCVTFGQTGGMIGVVALLVSNSFGIGMLYAGALLFGIGFSGSTLLPPVLIQEVFGGRDYASIYTTIMSASTLGVAFGTTLFSYLYDTTGSYYIVFIIVLVFFTITISSSLFSLKWKAKLNY
ncbi:hypothetical protein [Planococcus shenhongbingii]|uniref:Major facilitator superfamily (MFS) profile domain-containing protein n=1 Tax=Planococcus shenhongbingii TaxID=3058398 RepID=A0ABT8NF38_9BACL|nr:hypothetical protein [Planococcus sp. N017]MDN7246110.1 hypothetical protein [Planococcus sp. N017]